MPNFRVIEGGPAKPLIRVVTSPTRKREEMLEELILDVIDAWGRVVAARLMRDAARIKAAEDDMDARTLAAMAMVRAFPDPPLDAA